MMIGVPLTKNFIYSSTNKDLEYLKYIYIVIMVLFPFIFIVFFRLLLIRRARNVESVKLQRQKVGKKKQSSKRLSFTNMDRSFDSSRRASWLLGYEV